jgi:hypothetical protein
MRSRMSQSLTSGRQLCIQSMKNMAARQDGVNVAAQGGGAGEAE